MTKTYCFIAVQWWFDVTRELDWLWERHVFGGEQQGKQVCPVPSTIIGFIILTYPRFLPDGECSQMEEHFEFTPSPELALKKHDDDADEDFSYANGDNNSYSSLKSATSNQRNTWMRSSVRRNG